MSRPRSDPPVRRDGTCVVCGKPRPGPKLPKLYRAAMVRDPFCSTTCCRTWHGLPLGGASDGRSRNQSEDG